jgi:RNAse (barnase) inhibitor barstar
MGMRTLLLDGNDFSTLLSFYSAVEKVLTKDLGWEIGRNLDAFNDVLRGGFGVHDYEEPTQLIWLHSGKSRKDLGWEETLKYIAKKLKTCHPSNVEAAKRDLAMAQGHVGQTLFDLIVGIIKTHNHIELTLR